MKQLGEKLRANLFDNAVQEYNTGKYSIAELAKMHTVSTGKMYYFLKDSGCVFIRNWRKKMSAESREKIRKAKKGRKFTEEHRKAISESKSSIYNGLNGWGHTKKMKNGYILAYAPTHPKAGKTGYILLHRAIVEFQIGRYLNDDEVVHHMNHIRDDNRIENLIIMKKHDHMSMHMKERHEKRRNATLTACL